MVRASQTPGRNACLPQTLARESVEPVSARLPKLVCKLSVHSCLFAFASFVRMPSHSHLHPRTLKKSVACTLPPRAQMHIYSTERCVVAGLPGPTS